MRCTRIGLWFVCSLVSSLAILVSPAPSEKRATKGLSKQSTTSSGPKVKQLIQAEPQAQGENNSTSDWYQTVDLTNDINDLEYPSKIASEAELKAKASQNEKAQEKKKSNPEKPNFKTFCEDGSKSGNCLKVQEQGSTEDQNLNDLIETIKGIVNKKDSVDKNEMDHLRKLIEALAKKVDELQRNGCANNGAESTIGGTQSGSGKSKNRAPPQGPIAEIEETHIFQRKISKANTNHQENKQITSGVQNTVQNADAANSATRATMKMNSSTTKPFVENSLPSLTSSSYIPPSAPGDFLPVTASLPPEPPQVNRRQEFPIANPRPETPIENLQQASTTINRAGAFEKTASSSQMLTGQSNTNYLEGYPADVNYNGGINRPMDDLKRQWPGGHWPEYNENDIDENGSDSDLDEDDYYEDVPTERERDYEEYTPDSDLTPEYLEDIIQQERELLKRNDNIPMLPLHHIQEHKIPAKRSKVLK